MVFLQLRRESLITGVLDVRRLRAAVQDSGRMEVGLWLGVGGVAEVVVAGDVLAGWVVGVFGACVWGVCARIGVQENRLRALDGA